MLGVTPGKTDRAEPLKKRLKRVSTRSTGVARGFSLVGVFFNHVAKMRGAPHSMFVLSSIHGDLQLQCISILLVLTPDSLCMTAAPYQVPALEMICY